MHAATNQVLQWFSYDHLPEGSRHREVSARIAELAHLFAHTLEGPEVTAGLRKLLEAKDCLVRAAVGGDQS